MRISHFIASLSISLLIFGNGVHADLSSYKIDTEKSRILILVYPAGFSGLGHHHTVASDQVTGTLQYDADNIAKTAVALTFPLEALIVDDPLDRQKIGGDFSGEVDPKDIKGTRENMLEKVLEVDKYPDFSAKSVSVSGTLDDLSVEMEITLHGETKVQTAPVTVTKTAQGYHASSEFKIKQTRYDIEPLSLFFGAVAVRNRVKIRLDLHFKSAE